MNIVYTIYKGKKNSSSYFLFIQDKLFSIIVKRSCVHKFIEIYLFPAANVKSYSIFSQRKMARTST